MTKIPVGRKCTVIGCNGTAIAKGLCDKHRKRLARHGQTDDSVGKVVIDGYPKIMHHPLYESWRNITRANLGLDVCERWKDFPNFIADVGEKPAGAFRLARIDKSLPYGPQNSRWEDVVNSDEVRTTRREYMRKYQQRLRAANPDYFINADLKKSYNITLDQYNEMLSAQNGLCKICNKPESRKDKKGNLMRLHVDHCHSTNMIRGLLCHSCNTGLGLFQDSVENLQRAIEYLSDRT